MTKERTFSPKRDIGEVFYTEVRGNNPFNPVYKGLVPSPKMIKEVPFSSYRVVSSKINES